MLSHGKKRVAAIGLAGLGLGLAVVLAGRSPAAAAADRVPTDPGEVLAHTGGAGENAALRRALAANPRDLELALRVARADILLARQSSDPRYLGRAQAALTPWWTDDAPAAVLVLRATIEQSLHDFPSALRHLDGALARDPDNAQAWLTRAVVLTVLADYDGARASCAHVPPSLAETVCSTQIESLTGKSRAAHQRLAARVQEGVGSREEAAWALSSLGEYAVRFSDRALAERHFREALALAPDDAYTRSALADLLLDMKRYGEAAELVRGREADDGMLLRWVLAEPNDERVRLLAARFEASRARGDVVHRREEARFALFLGERDRAYDLARANFDVQKEPWDVRILLATARTPAEAAPAQAHLARTGLELP